MIHTRKSSFQEIVPLRIQYLNSLPEFQEMFLEFIIGESTYYKLQFANSTIGYAIKSADNILVEFYCFEDYVPQCTEYFNTILDELEISGIYCKSFDILLFNLCRATNFDYETIGYLYRNYNKNVHFTLQGLEVRFAEDADLPYLLRQNDEVFEPKHLLGSFIKNKGISLFEKDKIIAGCGFLTQIHSKYNYYDIGVWVNPEFRNRGYATQIVSYLKDYCLKNNVLPVCGCSAENIASQKTLAKAGFISTHELIEFTIAAK